MAIRTRQSRQQRSKGITPVQASWLTELSPKTINATIDRGELSAASRTRGLGTSDVLYLLLRKDIGALLSAQAKRELYERLARDFVADWQAASQELTRGADVEVLLAGGTLRVEVKRACLRLAKRWEALRNATAEVVSDPSIRAGELVVRGTRIPVYTIADLVAQGADPKELLEDYPALTAGKLRAVMAYIQTHPKRGRPRVSSWKARSKAGRARAPMNATSR